MTFDPAEAFVDIADVVIEALHARLDTHTPPAVLYHYTDAAGLQGILKGRVLWATHHRYLNDAKEGIYADELLREVFRAGAPDYTPMRPHDAAGWAARIRQRYLGHADSGLAVPHVISLTTRGDSLGQWRGYGANGRGFAIGLDMASVEKDLRIMVERIEYDPATQRALVEAMLREASERVAGEWSARATTTVEVSQLVDAAASALFGFAAVPAAMFKHEGFREEDEWRIVVEAAAAAPHASRPPSRARNGRLIMGEGTDPEAGPPCFVDEAKVRVSGAKLVPYFEVQLRRDAKLPLACIVIGPGQDPASTELAVRILLNEAGYPDGVEVRTSDIPYRP